MTLPADRCAGHDCAVVAPSLIPQRPGDRIKTNRRDALSLAKLHRAGELTPVWVPDVGHEAIRELVRAREGAMEALRRARQQLLSFLLRHGRIYTGRTPGPRRIQAGSAVKPSSIPPSDRAGGISHAIEEAEVRLKRLTAQVTETARHGLWRRW